MKKCNLFYLSGLLFFLVAVLNLVTGENHSTAVVWLCLGCNSLRGSFVFQTERPNFDKDEVCVCQPNRSIPLPRPALT